MKLTENVRIEPPKESGRIREIMCCVESITGRIQTANIDVRRKADQLCGPIPDEEKKDVGLTADCGELADLEERLQNLNCCIDALFKEISRLEHV